MSELPTAAAAPQPPPELEAWFLPELKVPELPGVRIEPLERRHEGALNDLFNQVFQKNRGMREFAWKYWDNPDGPGAGAVAVDENGGQVSAAYIIIPHVFWVNGAEGITFQVAETAVHPNARSGGRLIRAVFPAAFQIGRERGGILGYGGQSNEDAIKVGTRWFGYRILFALQPWEKRLSLAPALRTRAGAAGHTLGRAADLLLRSTGGARRSGFRGEFEPCTEFGPAFDELWLRLRARYPVALRRNAAYLNWRFARNPFGRHRALLAHAGKDPVGFVVWRTWEQDGIRRATVLDLLDGRDPEIAGALLEAAAREAAKDGCEFLFFSAMPASAAEAALPKLSGYKPSEREPVDRILAAPPRWLRWNASVIAQMLTLVDAKNWYYTQGDSDFRD